MWMPCSQNRQPMRIASPPFSQMSGRAVQRKVMTYCLRWIAKIGYGSVEL